jgi:uncharacterized protein (DUF488 family)
VEIHTIGFTKKTAEEFFGLLKKAGVKRLLDVRLRNTSQLAGWAKQADLAYFARELLEADYVHEPLLAPTGELLDGYRKRLIEWEEYEKRFLELMRERRVEGQVARSLFEVPVALLCTEAKPDRCHRRLVAEYLRERWGNLEISHL